MRGLGDSQCEIPARQAPGLLNWMTEATAHVPPTDQRHEPSARSISPSSIVGGRSSSAVRPSARRAADIADSRTVWGG